AKKIAQRMSDYFSGRLLWAYLGHNIENTGTSFESSFQLIWNDWAAAHPNGKNIRQENVNSQLIRHWLNLVDGKTLIIVDDVWDINLLNEFKKILPLNKIVLLITTRERDICTPSIPNRRLYEIGNLNSDNSLELLTVNLDGPERYSAELKKVAVLLGHHPLALVLANAWLVQNSIHDTPELLKLLEEADLKNPFAELELEDDRDSNLEKALSLSYLPLDDEQKRQFRLLSAIPKGLDFSNEMALDLWGVDIEDQSLLKRKKEELRELEKTALVERTEAGRYQLHTILHYYATALLIRQSDEKNDVYSNAKNRYFGQVLGIVYKIGALSPEKWDEKIEAELPHIYALGSMLFNYINKYLRKKDNRLSIETLSKPVSPSTLPTDFDEKERDCFNIAVDFTQNLSDIIKIWHLGETGKEWISLGLAASRLLKKESDEFYFLQLLTDWHRWECRMDEVSNYTMALSTMSADQAFPEYRLGSVQNIGLNLINIGKYHRALEYFKDALSLARDLKEETSYEAGILNGIGVCYSRMNEYDQAISYFQEALRLIEGKGEKLLEGTILYQLGNVYVHRYQLHEALSVYERALELRRAANDVKGESHTLNGLAEVCFHNGDFEKAIEYLEKALSIQQEYKVRISEGSTFNNLGKTYIYKYLKSKDNLDLEKAKEFLELSLDVRSAAGDLHGQAETSMNMAIYHELTNQKVEAAKYLKQAASSWVAVENFQDAANAFYRLYEVHKSQNKQEDFYKIFESMLIRGIENIDEKQKALIFSAIGYTYQQTGNWDKTKYYLEPALSIFQKLGNHIAEAQILNTLGVYYRISNQAEIALRFYKKAKNALNKSAKDQEEVRRRRLKATILNNIGLAYYYHDSFKNSPKMLREARKCHREARKIYQKLGDRDSEANQLYNLSLLYNPIYANQLLDEAIEICDNESPVMIRLLKEKERLSK
ncbi:MAG: tetratricopeptide repeat protein, partial [Candidatus Aminicenantes bacterium]